MSTVIVSDIYGLTDALTRLANEIDCCDIIDPYDGVVKNFRNESTAYNSFKINVGMDAYVKHIEKQLAKIQCNSTVVGFSAGASALWRLSEHTSSQNCIKNIVCFYPSQIRHYMNVCPVIPVDVIFPVCEAKFNVTDIGVKLSDKELVTVQQTKYLHGFMNQCSTNFSNKAYSHFSKFLDQNKLI